MLERVEMLTCVEELKMNYYLDKTKKKKTNSSRQLFINPQQMLLIFPIRV